jgi:CRISPR-associated protein Csb1
MTAAVVEALYERLEAAASLEGEDAGLRVLARYEPTGGSGTKVFPPSYLLPQDQRGSRAEPLYLTERRYICDKLVRTVLLDSTQSQANRCEQALRGGVERGSFSLPMLVLEADVNGQPVRISSLQAPHRSRDAYFRDSVLAGSDPPVAFDDTPVGKALVRAREDAARAYYRHAPTDLVYGSWDSHRGRRRQVRFPRVYTSEVIGLEPVAGFRGAGRMDPNVLHGKDKVHVPAQDPAAWTPDEKGKKRLTKIGHGVIPPSLNDDPRQPPNERGDRADPLAGGGVAVRGIRRQAYVNFAGLAQLRLGAPGEPATPAAERAGRAVLASLALLADRLAFARPAVFLRSGCDLLLLDEKVTFASRGGECEEVEISLDTALSVFEHAVSRAEAAGLGWDTVPLVLAPAANLQEALRRALEEVNLDTVVE